MTSGYRTATADDRRFVVSAWSSSFKAANSAGMIASSEWAGVMHAQINRILDSPGVRTVVAFEPSDPDFLYGFIAADLNADGRATYGDVSVIYPVVFYTYVKAPYRRAGHARDLFAAIGVDPKQPFVYTCETAIIASVARKIPLARWDPHVARFPKQQEQRP